ncbi:asparaginase [Aquincola sp. S2]|uniref:Asparaginase n=1 Tax=Pseudaquabacterium terrae TaxID=2732868 RepID=A0ABX2EJG9_9BURK|nr:asparaginase [Aquabacterium terrae]NRF68763.1 asparaginase [Aquabacterium terrae]
MPSTVVILGTGGTIAGTASNPADNVGYTAAQRGVAELVAAVPRLGEAPLELEQVAQVDSKDMDYPTWQRLAQRVGLHLARPEVCGIVITHGTDTMEETAWFLQRVLAPGKPVVLTGAMRPSTALQADGPQNLLDATVVAREPGACGVVVVFGGAVHSAHDVRKVHTYRIDAFSSGDAGPIARIEEGRLRRHRLWPIGSALGLARIGFDPASWPRVEVISGHAGSGAALVDALLASGVHGLIVAAPGNGSLHKALEPALRRAVAGGVPVWRCTRCAGGNLVGVNDETLPAAPTPSPWQARIDLMLSLLGTPG